MDNKPKRPRGRPPKPPEEQLTEQIKVMVSPADKAKYDALGRHRGPEILRQALRKTRI